MTANFILLVYPSAEAREHLVDALSDAGLQTVAAGSDDEALDQLQRLDSPPALLLAPFDGSSGGPEVWTRLREQLSTDTLPVAILGRGEASERLRALRLGFDYIPPPYHGEEAVLIVRQALDRLRDAQLLKGSLVQLPLADLLQTLEATKRSGTVSLKNRDRLATLWLRDGRVIDAEASGGLRGQEAVFAVACWEKGSFETHFTSVSGPERIEVSTSYLLLEAMRRKDEMRLHNEDPPHAALPDLPPPPPRSTRAVHRSLTLLAITSSYAAEHLELALLAQRLESCRQELLSEHPLLASFRVGDAGGVGLVEDLNGLQPFEVDRLILAVGAWLRLFFQKTERILPGRFSIGKLRALTEAIQEDLSSLGFYRALGLNIEEDQG